MKEIEISTKSLRRGAFAVGFGYYFGKEVAKMIDHAFCRTMADVFVDLAKNGNEIAQRVCDESNITYTEEKKAKESEVKMGFHM